jgi:conjugal transfer pilus assembly protein TraV
VTSLVLVAMLPGCINTGFSCKGYPEEARCQAVSQVLAQDPTETGGYLTESGAPAHEAPSNGSNARSAGNGRHHRPESGDVAVVGPAPLELGKPIVHPPHVIRAWLAPWRDHQDRLHEASYVYIMIDPAEWAYTGPTLGLRRQDRRGATALPRAPEDRPMPSGRERASGNGPGVAAPSGRPSPQAAGVAPAQTPPATAQPAAGGTAGVPPVLMVPGIHGQGMRPVPIPQIGFDTWGN